MTFPLAHAPALSLLFFLSKGEKRFPIPLPSDSEVCQALPSPSLGFPQALHSSISITTSARPRTSFPFRPFKEYPSPIV